MKQPQITNQQYITKIILLGDGAVGKTSLRKRYMGYGFVSSHLMTLGADFAMKSVKISNNISMKLQIWDIAGQPSFKQIRARFYSKTDGIILVFDLTRPETFMNLPNWINEVRVPNPGVILPLLIIGNKVDLIEERKVQLDKINMYIEQLKKHKEQLFFSSVDYLETSAKTGVNVNEGFYNIASSMYNSIIRADRTKTSINKNNNFSVN